MDLKFEIGKVISKKGTLFQILEAWSGNSNDLARNEKTKCQNGHVESEMTEKVAQQEEGKLEYFININTMYKVVIVTYRTNNLNYITIFRTLIILIIFLIFFLRVR